MTALYLGILAAFVAIVARLLFPHVSRAANTLFD